MAQETSKWLPQAMYFFKQYKINSLLATKYEKQQSAVDVIKTPVSNTRIRCQD